MPNRLVQWYRGKNPNDNRGDDELTLELAAKYPDTFQTYDDAMEDFNRITKELEAARKQALRDEATPVDYLKQTVGSAIRGVTSTAASGPEGLGTLIAGGAKAIEDASPGWVRLGEENKPVEERAPFTLGKKIGEAIRGLGEKFSPEPVEGLEDSFWASKLPQGVGSAAGFMLGGAAGKLAKIPQVLGVAGLGALSQGADAWKEAKASGLDDDKAFQVFLLNSGVGTTEAAPIGKWLKRLDGIGGGTIKKALIEAGKETFEESLQEAVQQTANNFIAQKYYDKDRNLLKDVAENAEVGGWTGALFSLLTQAIGAKIGKMKASGESQMESKTAQTNTGSNVQTGTEMPVQPEAEAEAGAAIDVRNNYVTDEDKELVSKLVAARVARKTGPEVDALSVAVGDRINTAPALMDYYTAELVKAQKGAEEAKASPAAATKETVTAPAAAPVDETIEHADWETGGGTAGERSPSQEDALVEALNEANAIFEKKVEAAKPAEPTGNTPTISPSVSEPDAVATTDSSTPAPRQDNAGRAGEKPAGKPSKDDWKSNPVSENQLKKMKELGLEPNPKLTAGEASIIMRDHLRKKMAETEADELKQAAEARKKADEAKHAAAVKKAEVEAKKKAEADAKAAKPAAPVVAAKPVEQVKIEKKADQPLIPAEKIKGNPDESIGLVAFGGSNTQVVQQSAGGQPKRSSAAAFVDLTSDKLTPEQREDIAYDDANGTQVKRIDKDGKSKPVKDKKLNPKIVVLLSPDGKHVVESVPYLQADKQNKGQMRMLTWFDSSGGIESARLSNVLASGWKIIASMKTNKPIKDRVVSHTAETWAKMREELLLRANEQLSGGIEEVSEAQAKEIIGSEQDRSGGVTESASNDTHEWSKGGEFIPEKVAIALVEEIGEPQWDNMEEADQQITDALNALSAEDQEAALKPLSPKDSRSGEIDYYEGCERLKEKLYEIYEETHQKSEVIRKLSGGGSQTGTASAQKAPDAGSGKTSTAGRGKDTESKSGGSAAKIGSSGEGAKAGANPSPKTEAKPAAPAPVAAATAPKPTGETRMVEGVLFEHYSDGAWRKSENQPAPQPTKLVKHNPLLEMVRSQREMKNVPRGSDYKLSDEQILEAATEKASRWLKEIAAAKTEAEKREVTKYHRGAFTSLSLIDRVAAELAFTKIRHSRKKVRKPTVDWDALEEEALKSVLEEEMQDEMDGDLRGEMGGDVTTGEWRDIPPITGQGWITPGNVFLENDKADSWGGHEATAIEWLKKHNPKQLAQLNKEAMEADVEFLQGSGFVTDWLKKHGWVRVAGVGKTMFLEGNPSRKAIQMAIDTGIMRDIEVMMDTATGSRVLYSPEQRFSSVTEADTREDVSRFNALLESLRYLGINVKLVTERMRNLAVERGQYTEGVDARGRVIRHITLAMGDMTTPTRGNFKMLLEEALHAVYGNESAGRKALMESAIAKLSDELLGIEGLKLSSEYSEAGAAEALQEERLVAAVGRKLEAEGFNPEESKGLGQAIVRWLKDLYHSITLAMMEAFGIQPSAQRVQAYFENRVKSILSGDAQISLIDFLGGPQLSEFDRMAHADPIGYAEMVAGKRHSVTRSLNDDNFDSEREKRIQAILAQVRPPSKYKMLHSDGTVDKWDGMFDLPGWLLPSGDFLVNASGEDHSTTAAKWLKSRSVDFSRGGANDKSMFALGAVRVVVAGDDLLFEGVPSRSQMSMLKDAAIENGQSLLQDLGQRTRTIYSPDTTIRHSETQLRYVDNPREPVSKDINSTELKKPTIAAFNQVQDFLNDAFKVFNDEGLNTAGITFDQFARNPMLHLPERIGRVLHYNPGEIPSDLIKQTNEQLAAIGQPTINPGLKLEEVSDTMRGRAAAAAHRELSVMDADLAEQRRVNERDVKSNFDTLERRNKQLAEALENYEDLEMVGNLASSELADIGHELGRAAKRIGDKSYKLGEIEQVIEQIDGKLTGEAAGAYSKALAAVVRRLGGGKLADVLEAVARLGLDWDTIKSEDAKAYFFASGEKALEPMLGNTMEAKALLAAVIKFSKSNSHIMDALSLRREQNFEARKAINDALAEARKSHADALKEAMRLIGRHRDLAIIQRDAAGNVVGVEPTRLGRKAARLINKIEQLKRENAKLLKEMEDAKVFNQWHQAVRPLLKARMAMLEQMIGAQYHDWQLTQGASYPVPKTSTSTLPMVLANTKTVDLTSDAKLRELRGDMMKLREWLDRVPDRLRGADWMDMDNLYKKVTAADIMRGHQNVQAGLITRMFAPMPDRLRFVGTPLARLLGSRIYNMQAWLRQFGSRVNFHGESWESAEYAAAKAMGFNRNDVFRRKVFQPLMGWFEKNMDVLASFTSEEDAINKAIIGAIKHLSLDPDMERAVMTGNNRALLARYIRLTARNAAWVAANGKSLNNKVLDEAGKYKVFRDALGASPFTVLRSFSEIGMNVYELMKNSLWAEEKLSAEAVADEYRTNAAAARARLAKYATPDIWKTFVRMWAYRDGRSAFYAPVNEGGVQTFARRANVIKAFNEAGGDLIKFAERLYILEDGRTDLGQFVGETIEQWQANFDMIEEMNREPSTSPDSMMPQAGPRRFIADARKSEELPREFLDYLPYDTFTLRQITKGQVYQAAFGRNIQAWRENLEAAKEEQKLLAVGYNSLAAYLRDNGVSEKGLRKAMQAEIAGGWKNLPGINGVATSATLEALENAAKNLQELNSIGESFNSMLSMNKVRPIEFRPWYNLLGSMAGATVSGIGTALTDNIATVEQPFRKLGFNWQAVQWVLGNKKSELAIAANSLLQAFAPSLMSKDARHVQLMNELGIALDDDALIPVKEKFYAQFFEEHNLANTRAARGAWKMGAAVRMFLSTGIGRARSDRPIYPTFKPHSVFTWGAQITHMSTTMQWWRTYESLLAAAVKHFDSNAADLSNPEFQFKPSDLSKLGFNSGWRAWEFLSHRVADYGLGSLEQLAREAIRRRAENPKASLLSNDAYIKLAQLAQNEITLDSGLATRSAFLVTNDKGALINPLLGWAVNKSYDFLSGFRNPDGKLSREGFQTALVAMMFGVLPAALAYALMRDLYDEYVMKRKANVRDLGSVNNTKDAFMTALDNFSRVGTMGIAGEVLNQSINYDSARPVSLDSRIFAVSTALNFKKAVDTLWFQGGATDWATTYRQFISALGGSGYLQYADTINGLLGLDNQEARYARRVSVNNYLRAAGRELELDVRKTNGSVTGMPSKQKMYVGQMVMSALANDASGFNHAYTQAKAAAKEEGSDNPADTIKRSFSAYHPMRIVFQTQPSDSEYQRMLGAMSDQGRASVAEAMRLYDYYASRLGIQPQRGRKESKTTPILGLPKLTSLPSISDELRKLTATAGSQSLF